MDHMQLYHAELPPVIKALAETPAVQRLRGVGMNCGCEYTSFPRFLTCKPYSRFDHSLGVGLIVWHFTHDEKQTAAGLLHDISTPVFAHVVDFLNGDYLTQESTELDTRAVILASSELCGVLQQFGLTVDEVCDYHLYPIADNDTPQLSADRLEYTVGNLLSFGFADLPAVTRMYEDLTVTENEQGIPELAFCSGTQALAFARGALRCSKVYVSDEDRFSMEALAQLLKKALSDGVLSRGDLMTAEPDVIAKLLQDPDTAARWAQFRRYAVLQRWDAPGEGRFCVDAKKRHLDPLVAGKGRVSALFPAYQTELTDFLSQPFDAWLSACEKPLAAE